MAETKTAQKFATQEEIEDELFEHLKASLEEWADLIPKELTFLQAGRENLDYEQIGEEEGFVNYIFRISERNPGKQSVVIKWSRTIPRVAQKQKLEFQRPPEMQKVPDHTFLQRNTKESEALKRVESLVPGSTPSILWVDHKRYFFIMEDLSDYLTLRQQLSKNDIVPEVFENIAQLLSCLHKATHIKTVGKEEFDKMCAAAFRNPMLDGVARGLFELGFSSKHGVGMLKAQREFSEPMKKVRPDIVDNEEITGSLQQLKESFLHVRRCFLQNDSHPGSFMVRRGDHDVRVLDLEFATFGNPAKEVGYFLGEVVMFYYVFGGRGRPDLAQKLKETVSDFITDYLRLMGDCIEDEAEFMRYLTGHAGHFAAFRTTGMAIQYQQFIGLDQAEADCLRATIGLIKGVNSINTLAQFLAHAFQ